MKKIPIFLALLFMALCLITVISPEQAGSEPQGEVITTVILPTEPVFSAVTDVSFEQLVNRSDTAPKVDLVEIKATQPEITVPKLASEYEIELLARTIWGEAEGVKSKDEQAAVAWCVLNRVDMYGDSIEDTILAPHQFYCRTWDNSVPAYFLELAKDVVSRWEREHAGYTDIGRTLPPDYLYFLGDGQRNHFTVEWKGTDCWDWSFPSPYEMEAST